MIRLQRIQYCISTHHADIDRPFRRRLLYAHGEMYCTHTVRCTNLAPEPNQSARRLCTFGPTMRYSCTQIPRKARFWADLGGFCEVSCSKYASWVPYRVTHVPRPLRYRYQAIHLTVCVQYGSVTVTQGSPYISNAVTRPRYMFWRANFLKAVQISPDFGFLGGSCA